MTYFFEWTLYWKRFDIWKEHIVFRVRLILWFIWTFREWKLPVFLLLVLHKSNSVISLKPLYRHSLAGFLVKGSDAAAKETQQAPDNNKSKSLSEPSPDQAAKKLKTEHIDEGPSHACRATTSSSSSDESGRASRREEKRTKKLMKFLCFMPF